MLNTHMLIGLRARREMAGLTPTQLAHAIGCSYASYLRYERGERRIYLDRAVTLARYIGCTVEQLGQEPSLDEQLEHHRKLLLARKSESGAQLDAPNSPAAAEPVGIVVAQASAPRSHATYTDAATGETKEVPIEGMSAEEWLSMDSDEQTQALIASWEV